MTRLPDKPRKRALAVRADIQRLAGRLPGDTGDHLVVPKAGQPYFDRSAIPIVGQSFMPGPHGLLLPAGALRPPDPIDLIQTYITFSDLMGFAPPATYVANGLRTWRRDDLIVACAELLGAYESLSNSRREIDERLAKGWFKNQAQAMAQQLIRKGSTLVAPQSLLLLTQWALLLSPDVAPEDRSPAHIGALIVALQDALGGRGKHEGGGDDESNVFRGETRSALFREVVSSADFYAQQDLGTTLAHHHERWVRLSRELRGESGAVDLNDAFLRATGVSKDDFSAVGLALWAHCQTRNNHRVARSAFVGLKLPPETVDKALALFSATRDRFVDEIARQDPAFLTEWSFTVVGRFPVLRLSDDSYVVLSKHLLIKRLFGWLPIFDVREGLKAAGDKAGERAAKQWMERLCEADALASLQSIASASRFYDSTAIQAAYGTRRKNADAVIDYPRALVVVEIGTHQLTRDTVVAGDADALEHDLHVAIGEKVKQLDATIKDLIHDERPLTGSAGGARHYIPVLVLTEGFPVNPMTMTAVRERLAAAGLLQDTRIGPLHILDQEELDIIEALAEQEGATLLGLLEEHEKSTLQDMSLKNWLLTDRTRRVSPVPMRPERLEAGRRALFDIALERLDRSAADVPG